jgi:sec-independent protein translocase protein TatA
MFGLGMQELLIIFGIMLLLFGGSRLPGIAAGLGGAVNSFKKALKGEEAADDRTLNADNTHGTKVPAATPSEANTKQG